MKTPKVKSAHIISFMESSKRQLYGEVGNEKRYVDDTIYFEVYTITKQPENTLYEYAHESIWVNMSTIVEHYPVGNSNDFYKGWICLGFKPIVSSTTVNFEKIFTDCIPPSELNFKFLQMEDILVEEDDNESLRSVDSFSTFDSIDSDVNSLDSFIVNSQDGEEQATNACECSFCIDVKQSVEWCDNSWVPADATAQKVKTLLENLEAKYVHKSNPL